MGADYYEVKCDLTATVWIKKVVAMLRCSSIHSFACENWKSLQESDNPNCYIDFSDFQTEADKRFLAAKGSVPIGIGRNSHIKRAIVDKNARIGENVKVIILSNYIHLHSLILLFNSCKHETRSYFLEI
jgi:ADP-glucose pyrophosphorylase